MFSVTKSEYVAERRNARVFDLVRVYCLFLVDRKCTAVRAQVPCLLLESVNACLALGHPKENAGGGPSYTHTHTRHTHLIDWVYSGNV